MNRQNLQFLLYGRPEATYSDRYVDVIKALRVHFKQHIQLSEEELQAVICETGKILFIYNDMDIKLYLGDQDTIYIDIIRFCVLYRLKLPYASPEWQLDFYKNSKLNYVKRFYYDNEGTVEKIMTIAEEKIMSQDVNGLKHGICITSDETSFWSHGSLIKILHKTQH